MSILEHPAAGDGGFLVDAPINKISLALGQDVPKGVYYKQFRRLGAFI